MPTPIPTQLNIAPRGKSWFNWQLIEGDSGFHTRETMEQFLCNPERVRDLEGQRTLLQEATDTLARINDQQATLILELEQQLEAVGAGGVEPLRKPVQPVQPVMYGIADGHGNGYFEDGCVALDAKDLQPEVDSLNSDLDDDEPPYKVVPLYIHPTQQGLADLRWQVVHDHISGEYIAGRACFVVNVQPMSGANIMRGSVAEHFTKAVDDIAAQIKVAAQAKQGEQA